MKNLRKISGDYKETSFHLPGRRRAAARRMLKKMLKKVRRQTRDF